MEGYIRDVEFSIVNILITSVKVLLIVVQSPRGGTTSSGLRPRPFSRRRHSSNGNQKANAMTQNLSTRHKPQAQGEESKRVEVFISNPFNIFSTISFENLNYLKPMIMNRLFLYLIGALALSTPASGGFVHPGLLHTQADFSRMAQQVAANATPWISSWNRLIGNSQASSSYNPNAQSWLCRGICCNPDNSYSLMNDVAAAYQLALRWKISGNTAYADAAVRIMNAWSSTLTGIGCNANGSSWDFFLLAGIQGYQFANVGEIMRNYSGLTTANFTAFQNMMRNIFYPLTVPGGWPISVYSSWDLCAMAATMGIGVLTDNQTMFNSVLTYFYTGAGNGALGNFIYYIHPGYLGQTQESGRDQGHNTLSISLFGAIAEMAWNQGIDLYGYANNRFLAASEYVARGNLIQSGSTYYSNPFATYIVNDWPTEIYDTVFSASAVGNVRPSWASIYNHYVNRKGLSAPYTQSMMNFVAPDGGGGNYGSTSGGYDQLGFETLTFTRSPISQGSPPSGLTGYLNASSVQLSWWGTYNASSYNVLRGTVSGGPYSTLITGITEPRTYTDSNLATGVNTYYYVVTAVTPSGTTQNSNEAKVVANPLAPTTYLTFEQSSGTVAIDASGNGNNGTLVGGASFVAGTSNLGVALDGSTGYVSLPAGITANLSDFTIAAWLKLNTIKTWMRLFDFGYGTERNMFFTPLGVNGNATFAITLNEAPGEFILIGPSPLPVGQWVHVAITLAGQVASYYVNGNLAATASGFWPAPFQLASPEVGSTGLTPQNWIGRSQYSGSAGSDPYLNGTVDEFRIYQGALTASQINTLANKPLNTLLTFDQTSGTVAADSSGNGHSATLIGGASFVSGIIGNAVSLDGSSGYVSLPTGIVSSLTDFTIASWVYLKSRSSWMRIFDFGSGTGTWMMLTVQGTNGDVTFGITVNGNSGEFSVVASQAVPVGQWTHLAVTMTAQIVTIYMNGTVIGTNTGIALAPFQLGSTTQNWLGRSQWPSDPYLNGILDDFRIYQGAYTAAQIATLVNLAG